MKKAAPVKDSGLEVSQGQSTSKNNQNALAPIRAHMYFNDVAAKSVTGFGDPSRQRRTGADHTAGAFFMPAAPSYGGCARETFGSAGILCPRFANLRTAATLIRLATNRGSSSDKGARPMKHTLSTSVQNRAAAQRARALAALRANSSLSVRLARYNSAMAKARALEAVGGAV